MAFLEAVVFNLAPMLIVMSVLAIFVVHRSGLWRGILGAWVAMFVISLAIAFLYPDYWSLNCGFQGLLRSGVGHVSVLNPSLGRCLGDNYLPLWLLALPPLSGIAILLSWVWRHVRPSPEAIQTIAILMGSAIGAVLIGQLNDNLALLFVVVVAATAYAWPRLLRPRAA